MILSRQSKHLQRLEAMGKLSPAIAHDINNLLSGILGYSQIILGDPSAAGLRPYIEEIEKAGKRIAVLTRVLQVFSHKQLHHMELLDLNQCLQELEKFIPHIVGPEIQFSASRDSGLRQIRADKSRIRRALLILAIDSVNLLPQGGSLAMGTRNCEAQEGQRQEVLLLAALKGVLDRDLALAYPREEADELQAPKEESKPEAFGLAEVLQMCDGRVTTAIRSETELEIQIYLPTAPAA